MENNIVRDIMGAPIVVGSKLVIASRNRHSVGLTHGTVESLGLAASRYGYTYAAVFVRLHHGRLQDWPVGEMQYKARIVG